MKVSKKEFARLRKYIQKLENHIFNDVRDLKITLFECQIMLKETVDRNTELEKENEKLIKRAF